MRGYLKASEIAEIYSVHVYTVYRWIKQKRIKAIKIGKRWFFSKKEYINE